MIGEEVVGHRDDGTELMPFQKPSHHGSEAGGNIPCLFRIRWCNGLAAALGIGLAPFCRQSGLQSGKLAPDTGHASRRGYMQTEDVTSSNSGQGRGCLDDHLPGIFLTLMPACR